MSMEPSTKKRKLAPKVGASPALNAQPASSRSVHEPSTDKAEIKILQSKHESSHETQLAQRQDFESFVRHLQDAAMLIQRQAERPPYRHVSVLLLSWEHDRSGHDDIVALEQVLQRQYHFATQRWQIPTGTSSSAKFSAQMASFLKNAEPSRLLIIHYVGSACAGPDGQLYWACAPDDAAQLKWDDIRRPLQTSPSDICLLLDGCAVPDSPLPGSYSTKQGIASSALGNNSGGCSGHSLTAHLTQALRALQTGPPFSVRRLHEEIVAQQQLQMPQRGNPPSSATSTITPPSRLPVFFSLDLGKRQHLTLAPLLSRPVGSGQNGDSKTVEREQSSRQESLIDSNSLARFRFDEERILACTSFVGDASPDMTFFNQWLQNTCHLGSKISVEGMFLGPPTMLIISMPHAIWDIIQHDKICLFIGYVSSHNMIQMYEKLLVPVITRRPAGQVEGGSGRTLETGDNSGTAGSRTSRDDENQKVGLHASVSGNDKECIEGPNLPLQSNPSQAHFERKRKSDIAADSVEIQEAAEQLKALSHLRQRSDEARPAARPRTTLPDAVSNSARERARAHAASSMKNNSTTTHNDPKTTPGSKIIGSRRSAVKQETQCSHCGRAPFKDHSSLRKHVAAAHTRPYPCAFAFAGCASTFGSKNEWKRHMASQHLCLQIYRCSDCPQSVMKSRGNEFNRKDLFTQHLRRMHALQQIKRAVSRGDAQMRSDWDSYVKEMQRSCVVTRRRPPQKAACPKRECQKEFEGVGAWHEWTEHVGRHMEREPGLILGADQFLINWALDQGIIEQVGNGRYRLSAANGAVSAQSSSVSAVSAKDSMRLSLTGPFPVENGSGKTQMKTT